jgi:hypothetical protein
MSLTVIQKFQRKVKGAVMARDFDRVRELYSQYGSHLQLVERNSNSKGSFGVLAVSIPHHPLLKVEDSP